MPKQTDVLFLVSRAQVDDLPTWNALDLLRYDQATVQHNSPNGFYLLKSCSANAPHRERWRAHGVFIAWIGGSEWQARAWVDKQNQSR